MRIVMLGAPGAGKGSQAIKLADRYAIPHISTGDIFRANIKAGTALGKEAKQYMDKGELVPDSVTIGMLLERISQADCRQGYILDGFPRTIPQAESLTKALADKGEKLDFALDIDVADEIIVKRMGGRRTCPQCGATYHVVNAAPKQEGICDRCGAALITRPDDQPETVKERLRVYHSQTEPLIQYYKAEGILQTVEGKERSVDAVFEDLIAILEG